MASTAQRLGYAIVQAEAELDAAFKRGTADEASVLSMTARIGELNAELPAAHLTAHLKTPPHPDGHPGGCIQRCAWLRHSAAGPCSRPDASALTG